MLIKEAINAEHGAEVKVRWHEGGATVTVFTKLEDDDLVEFLAFERKSKVKSPTLEDKHDYRDDWEREFYNEEPKSKGKKGKKRNT